MLDRLIKISSLSGAVLVFWGFLKLVIYYSAFDIEIVDFLSISEIITSFLDDINLLIILAMALALQSFPLFKYVEKKSYLKSEHFYDQFLIFVYGKRYRFLIVYLITAILIVVPLALDYISLNYFVIYILIFCVIQSLTCLFLSRNENTITISNIGTFSIFSLTVGCAIFLLAIHDIIQTKSGARKALIVTSSQIIVLLGRVLHDSGNL